MSVFRKRMARGATRRWPADRAATCRGRPGTAGHDVNTPTRLPDQLVSSFFSFYAFTHEQQQSSRSAIAAVKPRRRLAHAPSQKRVG